MSPVFTSSSVAAEDRRRRRIGEAAADRQVREARQAEASDARGAISLRSRLWGSRPRRPATSPRWQPVTTASIDLRCLRAD